MRDYEEILKVLEPMFGEREQYSIKELIYSPKVRNFSVEEVSSLIKFLITYDKIHIINSKDRRFEDYLVEWNYEKELALLPVEKELSFELTDLCLSLPPFDKFGLSDFLNSKGIKIFELQKVFSDLFSEAKYSIKICSPFLEFSGFEFFKDIIVSKARKNISIKILSRQIKLSEKDSRYEDIKKILEYFKLKEVDHNISIRNYYYLTADKKLASSIHAKIIIIDSSEAYIGSGEIRKNSFEKNFELGVILSGEKVSEIELIFDNIFSKAEEVTVE